MSNGTKNATAGILVAAKKTVHANLEFAIISIFFSPSDKWSATVFGVMASNNNNTQYCCWSQSTFTK